LAPNVTPLEYTLQNLVTVYFLLFIKLHFTLNAQNALRLYNSLQWHI